jgi:hypothetical protein
MPHYRRLLAPLAPLVAGLALAGLAAAPAGANHSWGGYHWARTANPFTLSLGDSVSGDWDTHLAVASADWSESAVLNTQVVDGNGTNPKRCVPTTGRVEVCATTYGKNGWLGIASIWASGGHITKGSVKNNDTYFNTATYDTPAWRQFVMCQEIGHTFGLDHQDENFGNANLGSCMDYTNDPSTNQHPDKHDYAQLASIYAHLDTSTTVAATAPNSAAAVGAGNSQAEWGTAIRYSGDGRPSLFVRELPNDQQVFTFVIWAS